MRRMEVNYPRGETEQLVEQVRRTALPLRDAADLDPLLERIGDARCVLLGEASHGTSEYYRWRTALSQRLIEEKGFRFIAVEGDWPDCYRVNGYVKGLPGYAETAHDVLYQFDRWPTWMWANWEIEVLVRWLHTYNQSQSEEQCVGFYGLDVYSLWDSMRAVIRYLEHRDPEAAARARWAYGCFDPYQEDAFEYARSAHWLPASCEEDVVAMLRELHRRASELQRHDGVSEREAFFCAEQNALVVRNAERYYRTVVRGGAASWNVRDRHMMETLNRLMDFHGPDAKAIVWEHNTHIGDARATDMAEAGMVNIGQLAREEFGEENVVLVGFGSHRGSVIAADAWEAPMERMEVPPGHPHSWEDVLHQAGPENKLLMLTPDRTPESFYTTRGHRAIGVVYNPALEMLGNYVPTVLPRRYDAFLYIDETEALHPLHLPERAEHELPETFPSGV